MTTDLDSRAGHAWPDDDPKRKLAHAMLAGVAFLRRQEGIQLGHKSIASSLKTYEEALRDLIQELLRGGKRLSKGSFRAQMKGLIKTSANDVAEEGWVEGKGDPEDMESDDLAVISDWVSDQRGHVNDFSDWLTAKESDLDEVDSRVEAWSASMKNLGQVMKARAMGDPVLRFDGTDGDIEPCDTCDELKGQKHKLSWWQGGNPDGVDYTQRGGNSAYDCGHWDSGCRHHFYHAKTGELIIE